MLRFDLTGLGELINERTRIVAVSHQSNVTGAMPPVAQIAAAAHAAGAIVVVDAAQSVPHHPVSVTERARTTTDRCEGPSPTSMCSCRPPGWRCACSESRWEEGKLAVVIRTVNFPLGSVASWRSPPPQAVRRSAASTPQITAMRLDLTAAEHTN